MGALTRVRQQEEIASCFQLNLVLRESWAVSGLTASSDGVTLRSSIMVLSCSERNARFQSSGLSSSKCLPSLQLMSPVLWADGGSQRGPRGRSEKWLIKLIQRVPEAMLWEHADKGQLCWHFVRTLLITLHIVSPLHFLKSCQLQI